MGSLSWNSARKPWRKVSIQLVSPASGEHVRVDQHRVRLVSVEVCVSIQLVSPASGELMIAPHVVAHAALFQVSIQLVSPASGEFHSCTGENDYLYVVSIQLVSPASGESGFWKPLPA